jgi:hypothetical protein
MVMCNLAQTVTAADSLRLSLYIWTVCVCVCVFAIPFLIITRVSSIVLCAPSAKYIHTQTVTATDSLSVYIYRFPVCVCVCTHTHTHTHTRTHTICSSAVVGTGERICNSLFGYQSSLVHYVICPPRSHTSLLPTINGGAHSKMDEACAEGLFGDSQRRGGGGSRSGSGGHALGGGYFYIARHLQRICNNFNN